MDEFIYVDALTVMLDLGEVIEMPSISLDELADMGDVE